MSSWTAQGEFRHFDNSFRAPVLLQQLCFSLGAPPNEQLCCSTEHLSALWQFIFNIRSALAILLLTWKHFQMSSCIVQTSTLLSFDSSFWAVALLQHFCFSLRKPPHEQLHCSKEHIFVLWQFMLSTCTAPSAFFLSSGTPQSEQLHCSGEHLFVLWQLNWSTCADPAILFFSWDTSTWAVALVEGNLSAIRQLMSSTCTAPATLLLTWNTSKWAVALLRGASFYILTTLFDRLCCSSNCVSHLEHLEMSCCIAQWTMFLFLDNSCWSLALLQQLGFSLGSHPNEQLHCSKKHLSVVWHNFKHFVLFYQLCF